MEMLDGTPSEFERLVGVKDTPELLDELERMKAPQLRRILLARALLEQQRRADHSEQALNGH